MHQLAAIMFPDLAEYTSLTDKDNDAAYAMLVRNRAINKERIKCYKKRFKEHFFLNI